MLAYFTRYGISRVFRVWRSLTRRILSNRLVPRRQRCMICPNWNSFCMHPHAHIICNIMNLIDQPFSHQHAHRSSPRESSITKNIYSAVVLLSMGSVLAVNCKENSPSPVVPWKTTSYSEIYYFVDSTLPRINRRQRELPASILEQ